MLVCTLVQTCSLTYLDVSLQEARRVLMGPAVHPSSMPMAAPAGLVPPQQVSSAAQQQQQPQQQQQVMQQLPPNLMPPAQQQQLHQQQQQLHQQMTGELLSLPLHTQDCMALQALQILKCFPSWMKLETNTNF